MSVYRDDLGALRMQARQRIDALTVTEETLCPLFWETLDPAEISALPALRKGVERSPDGLDREGIDRLFASLDGIERIVYGALDRLPSVESLWNAPAAMPDALPTHAERLWPIIGFAESHYESLAAEWRALLRTRDREATLEREDDEYTWRGVLRVEGVGVRALWEPMARNANNNAEDWITLGVSMPRATARLRLRPRGWSDDLLGVIGVRGGEKIHDEQFDGYFVVEATPEASGGLLPAEVKKGLLEISQEDVPLVEVNAGYALVRWTFAPSARSVGGALRALLAWHRAGPTRRFRR